MAAYRPEYQLPAKPGLLPICSIVVRENDSPIRCARHFSAAGFSGAALTVASIRIENEDLTVFEADLEWASPEFHVHRCWPHPMHSSVADRNCKGQIESARFITTLQITR